jgi:hypothetical protein
MVHTNINGTLSDKTGEESHFVDGKRKKRMSAPETTKRKKDKMLANSDGVKKYLDQSLKGGDHG